VGFAAVVAPFLTGVGTTNGIQRDGTGYDGIMPGDRSARALQSVEG
jgi:hypothetical protein